MIKRQPLPADIRERLPCLAERFRHDPRVVALYLFGSFARGEEDRLSDMDLALLLDSGTPRTELDSLRSHYLAQVSEILGTDEVSFVLLNDAPLTFRHQIIRTGTVLLDTAPSVRIASEGSIGASL